MSQNASPPSVVGHGGLDPTTVDEVLDYSWKSDQIEAIMTLGGRHPPALISMRDSGRRCGDLRPKHGG